MSADVATKPVVETKATGLPSTARLKPTGNVTLILPLVGTGDDVVKLAVKVPSAALVMREERATVAREMAGVRMTPSARPVSIVVPSAVAVCTVEPPVSPARTGLVTFVSVTEIEPALASEPSVRVKVIVELSFENAVSTTSS